MRRTSSIISLILILAFAVACSKPFVHYTYKPLAMSKVVAEEIAKTAKEFHTEGKITDAQLERVRQAYEKARLLNNAVIDTLVALIDAGVDPRYDANYNKLIEDFNAALKDLYNIAKEFKIIKE